MADVYVPDEILDNILVRLPTKSLSRFRCVSRHWNGLISNPDFMKSLQRRKIFVPGQYCQTIEKVVSGENRMGYRMVMADHSPFEGQRVTVGGTDNGLVLLVLNYIEHGACIVDMNLYNPLTRVVLKKIPNPHYVENNVHLAFGLCHGATQDDLKIVTLGRYNFVMSLSWGVFSVKNQSWSAMSETIGYFEFSDHAGTFLNGFLHWRVRKDHSSVLILALDIEKMKLTEIEVPYNTNFNFFTTLGTVNGCLCWICPKDIYPYGGYELFVMKDHGIWELCSKGCSTSKVLSRMKYDIFSVMCILDEGKVIMKNRKNNTFVIVDLVKDSSEPILVCTGFNQKWTPLHAIEYVESFCNI